MQRGTAAKVLHGHQSFFFDTGNVGPALTCFSPTHARPLAAANATSAAQVGQSIRPGADSSVHLLSWWRLEPPEGRSPLTGGLDLRFERFSPVGSFASAGRADMCHVGWERERGGLRERERDRQKKKRNMQNGEFVLHERERGVD